MSPSIEFLDVRKSYGAQPVLRGVSFKVQRGEILGLLGPNGCGKTTTLRLVAGFLSPDSGEVRVCGEPIGSGSLAARRRIGYLPERAPLYDALRVRDYLDFVAAAKGVARSVRTQAIDRAIANFALENVVKKPVGTLSKGYRQRVGLAQATLADPEVLLLDEATNGLDALQIVEARALIRRGSAGRAVIFCSHLMQEVTALCDRVIVLHEGRTVAMADAAAAPRLELRMSGMDAEAALAALSAVAGVSDTSARDDFGVTVFECSVDSPEVADALARRALASGRLLALETKHPTLEDRFIAAVTQRPTTAA
ncbi:MAG: ABC transporter ATP-binding protein [Burkholderiaceae bacterium]